jgi:hypothetical protein
MRRSIEVRAKRDAFFADLAQIVQAENLEAARIGEDGSIPRHEAVQPAHLANRLDSGTQIKMIGIAEQNLDAKLFQHILRNALDRTERSHRHEYGRLDFSVRSDEFAQRGQSREWLQSAELSRQERIVTGFENQS